jgi:hypothetical protein
MKLLSLMNSMPGGLSSPGAALESFSSIVPKVAVKDGSAYGGQMFGVFGDVLPYSGQDGGLRHIDATGNKEGALFVDLVVIDWKSTNAALRADGRTESRLVRSLVL